jgi:hypothetical protein
MKRPILQAGLIVGALSFGQAGCHQTDKTAKTTDYTPKKKDDPTAWTDKDVGRGSSDSGAGNSGLAPSDGLKGTWSSEGQQIEKDLGVGR